MKAILFRKLLFRSAQKKPNYSSLYPQSRHSTFTSRPIPSDFVPATTSLDLACTNGASYHVDVGDGCAVFAQTAG